MMKRYRVTLRRGVGWVCRTDEEETIHPTKHRAIDHGEVWRTGLQAPPRDQQPNYQEQSAVTFKKNDIVTEKPRLPSAITATAQPRQRKVYLVLGPSKVAGKIRIATWSHATKSWSLPRAAAEDSFAPAPDFWPQTKAAQQWVAERGWAAVHAVERRPIS